MARFDVGLAGARSAIDGVVILFTNGESAKQGARSGAAAHATGREFYWRRPLFKAACRA
jgi:hypothetical protein